MDMPRGYLKISGYLTHSIRTAERMDALEAVEFAVRQKFKQFAAMNSRTFDLASESPWQGYVFHYEKGYYIQLEGTKSNFVAFVADDKVIRKPRNTGFLIHRYYIEGCDGLIEFMSNDE